MSAWHVLSAIGIYQMAQGNFEFMVGRPIVDRARLRMKNGWFEAKVINNSSENKYVE
jgi:putative alpha-1,2-mannosidase